MPPLPVIADVFRVTWNFATSGGVTPRIVQHFRQPSGDEHDLGNTIWDSVQAGMFGPMHQNYEPDSIDILALDGSSSTVRVTNPSFGSPQLCSSTGDLCPAMAYVLSFKTGQRGPRGRGRSYVGPITEDGNDQGFVDTTKAIDMSNAFVAFAVAISSGTPPAELVVASYVHADAHSTTSLTVDTPLGTQRRRQDQLR